MSEGGYPSYSLQPLSESSSLPPERAHRIIAAQPRSWISEPLTTIRKWKPSSSVSPPAKSRNFMAFKRCLMGCGLKRLEHLEKWRKVVTPSGAPPLKNSMRPPWRHRWGVRKPVFLHRGALWGKRLDMPDTKFRERPQLDDDNWEPHLVDHQKLHLKPLFHFTIQKRHNTKGI